MGPIRYVRFKLRQMARFHQLTLRTDGSSSEQNPPHFYAGHKNTPPMEGTILVALVGLEPTLIAELDFESSASTNSATGPWH